MVPALLASLLLISLGLVDAAKQLPTWLVPCYRDDPKFNECALAHGRQAIPTVVQGHKKLRMPVLDPLEVSELRVAKEATRLGIDFVMTDIKMFGLKRLQLQDYRVDFEKRQISMRTLTPRIELLCTYDISGQILVLPIVGHGPGNITCENVTMEYNLKYDLEKRQDGEQYMNLKDSMLDIKMSRVYIHFDNLFNGNKLLGESTNAFLNENWSELESEMGPAIGEALSEVTKQIFNRLAKVIPFDTIHPLKGQ